MSFLDALIGAPQRRASAGDGGSWTPIRAESPTAAGVGVSEEKALSLPAIFRAVDNLSSHIAMLKLPFYRRLTEDGPDRMYDDPRDWMMNSEANPEISAYNARKTWLLHAILWGNGYGEPVFNGRGIAVEFWPITDPHRISPKRDSSGRLYYEVRQPNGTADRIEPGRLLHIFNLSANGVCGYPLVRALARENVGLQLAIEKYASGFFGNGVNVGTIFRFPGPMTREIHQETLETIRREYGAPHNAGKPFLTHSGMEVEREGTSNKDAMMVESLTWSVGDVARWMNVPPYKLFELSRATFSNVEHADLEYTKWSLAPWFKQIEQELTRKLVKAEERRTHYFEHGVDTILRGDTASRVEYYKAMSERGMSINQILRMENMKGIGPVGDLHLVQSNMTTLETLAKAGEPKGEDPAAKAIDFKRELVKTMIADGTLSDVMFNLMKGKKLLEDVNIDTVDGVEEPWLPVIADNGQLVSGEVIKDSEGDIVGGDVLPAAGASEGGGLKPGDRVKILNPHDPTHKTGVVDAIGPEQAITVIIDGMEDMGPHKWYVESELERIGGDDEDTDSEADKDESAPNKSPEPGEGMDDDMDKMDMAHAQAPLKARLAILIPVAEDATARIRERVNKQMERMEKHGQPPDLLKAIWGKQREQARRTLMPLAGVAAAITGRHNQAEICEQLVQLIGEAIISGAMNKVQGASLVAALAA